MSLSIKGQCKVAASNMGRGPLARKKDHSFLQGHVTTKNPPELHKCKYSRNGSVVNCAIPTKSAGNFKEPAQALPVYVKVVNVISFVSSFLH